VSSLLPPCLVVSTQLEIQLQKRLPRPDDHNGIP
jgi:hypothetical protein